MKRALSILVTIVMVLTVKAADPTMTSYTFDECLGSDRPYPAPDAVTAAPDSLKAVYINYVGRHGARYPVSATRALTLQRALEQADSLGTITPSGRQLLALTYDVVEQADGRWGALDELGMEEMRGIATRMYMAWPRLFAGMRVDALSSYSPRCMMSMYEFVHRIDRLNNDVEVYTSSGRQNSKLMRPFDIDADYIDYARSQVWGTPYNDYVATQVTAAPLKRILGEAYPIARSEIADLALAEYHFLASLPPMGIEVDINKWLTPDEANALWSCANLRQYLLWTATTLSTAPSDLASPLLLDLIRTTDAAIEGRMSATAVLRFGHAETLLPLLSLLRVNGGYYLTNYFDTVRQHFRNFDLVPMGANLQMILFKDGKGRYFVRFDLNEQPIKLIPNDDRVYLPWSTARDYMVRCLPLIDRP